MAASAMALLAGCPVEAVIDSLREFAGLEHRLEFVRELNGVSYFNDSKGTNVGAVLNLSRAFQRRSSSSPAARDKAGRFLPVEDLVKERVKAADVDRRGELRKMRESLRRCNGNDCWPRISETPLNSGATRCHKRRSLFCFRPPARVLICSLNFETGEDSSRSCDGDGVMLKYDKWLLLLTVLLTGFGALMIYSCNFGHYACFCKKRGYGILLFQETYVHDPHRIYLSVSRLKLKLSFLQKSGDSFLIFSFVLLVLVFVPGIGVSAGGARRWIQALAFDVPAIGTRKAFHGHISCAVYVDAGIQDRQFSVFFKTVRCHGDFSGSYSQTA